MTFAFLLTSQWQDDNQLVFWWKTEQGAVRQQVEQPSVCFIQQCHQEKAEKNISLMHWPIDIRPISLKHFNGEPVSACYMPSSYRYRWQQLDRKSTRLNCSHVRISYAVFCLKKKKRN